MNSESRTLAQLDELLLNTLIALNHTMMRDQARTGHFDAVHQDAPGAEPRMEGYERGRPTHRHESPGLMSVMPDLQEQQNDCRLLELLTEQLDCARTSKRMNDIAARVIQDLDDRDTLGLLSRILAIAEVKARLAVGPKGVEAEAAQLAPSWAPVNARR